MSPTTPATVGLPVRPDFSTQLVKLGTDLVSFYNALPEQAIEAIGAALRGESEPIHAYGVLLDDAALRQEASGSG